MAILLANGQALFRASGGAIGLSPVVPAPENFSATSASHTAILFQTSSQSRDQEIAFTARPANATGFMRYDGTKAIYCRFAGATTLEIGLASGIVGQNWNDPGTTYGRTYVDVGVSTGTVTCGVSGVDIYVKVNGTDVVRFKEWRICSSGYAMIKAASGQSVAGTVTFLANATLYSTPATYTYDIRDFGAKSKATTGSITASSTTLTVANVTDFAVGDFVIVETGGEAGAGLRGSVGVGGTWPALSYANAVTRLLDTGQTANTWAWQADTGDVYRWVSSAWVVQPSSSYYTAKVIPQALHAKITGISGSDLTLSVAATATATNANVYIDNAAAINYLTTPIYYGYGSGTLTSFMGNDHVISIPAATWYVGGKLYMRNASCGRFVGVGATSILKTPKGCPSAFLDFYSYTSKRLAYNLKIVGNCRDEGFNLGLNKTWIPQGGAGTGMVFAQSTDGGEMIAATSNLFFNGGLLMTSCTSCDADSITSVDVWQKSIGMDYGTDCWGRNSATTYTDGFRQYIQWAYLYSDGTGGGFENCTVTCGPRLVAGFESFRSTGVTISGCTGYNAVFSSNSSGDFTYTNNTCVVTVTDNVSATSGFSQNNPMCNINSNIQPPDASMELGGTITNFVATQASHIDSSGNSLRGIVVNYYNPNVTIAGGSYTAPNYQSGSTLDGACGILATGENTTITNFTVVGTSKYGALGGDTQRNVTADGSRGSTIDAFTKANVGDWTLTL